MISTKTSEALTRKLPWWTWVVTAIILHAGTQVSLLFKYDNGLADYYLPTALSIILIHWWGPWRVLPIMYLNATLSLLLWDISVEGWYEWLAFGVPETLFAFLSWYLFRIVFKGRFWLPDIRDTVLFLIFGIIIPVIPEIFLLQSLLLLFVDQPEQVFWMYSIRNFLGEFTSSFGFAVPALYYLSPLMQRRGLIQGLTLRIPPTPRLKDRRRLELIIIFIVIAVLVFTIEFEKFWYIYGIVSLYTAIRFGFGPAVLTNFYILLSTYLLPRFLKDFGYDPYFSYADVVDIFLGISLLFVFAAITGRVISDIKIAEVSLYRKNRELDNTNRELDRFVYSVSHDLSAPLKSILGLVNISRMAKGQDEQALYLSKIESSVVKLEMFIAEILDYSKNKRQEIVAEQIKLQEICHEILSNLQFMEEFNRIQVDLKGIENESFIQDKMRLKIILNNLLTNAVKFQKKTPGHKPFIKISSRKVNEKLLIEIEDNGEGIREELVDRIFDMFYRGTENAKGSGLGLYIAKEAAGRIHGRIFVDSQYGKGSRFTLELARLNIN